MSNIAIRVENLSKQYQIGSSTGDRWFGYKSLRDTIADAFTTPFRRARALLRGQAYGASEMNETIWALKDVSFEVKRGEVVGIIGHNGAGKSTLLKILSRITEPTEGQAAIYGRVGSLLEVGTGFHPELTGRENIYLNGAILGMRRAQIERQFDEIVAFAEVEKFIDTPVKHYSSGMYLRLAFAVAAHLEPEILLVDEGLAVGDAQFQKKCQDKMSKVAEEGRTVLFVSHNLGAIRALCQRVFLLHDGKLHLDGLADDVISKYLSLTSMEESLQGEVIWEPPLGSDSVQCLRLRLLNEAGQICHTFVAHEKLIVEFDYQVLKPLNAFRFKLSFVTDQAEIAFDLTDYHLRTGALLPGYYWSRCVIPPDLFNQRRYTIMIGAGKPVVRSHIESTKALSFQVLRVRDGRLLNNQKRGVVAPKTEWSIDHPIQE